MEVQANRVAIVTGASGGIGGCVALRLAADGFAVVLGYAGRPDAASETAAAIRGKGGKAIAIAANVSDPQEVRRLFESTRAEFGSVTAVVHSAGIMPLARIDSVEGLEVFERVIAVNLRGSFIVMSEASRMLGPGGRIIVFSSSVLAKSFPTYGPYIASKAGVEGLVRVLANELRGRGVTVNAVAPGPVATPLFLNGKSAAQIAELSKAAPLERLGAPEDIANVVSFLAGPDGEWVNGQILRANGGFA